MSHNLSPEALDTVLDVVLQNMRSGECKLWRYHSHSRSALNTSCLGKVLS